MKNSTPVFTPQNWHPAFPKRFYSVDDLSAPLYASELPGRAYPWRDLGDAGVDWVVCLCSEQPMYDPGPLKFLTCVELTDLYDGGDPGEVKKELAAIGNVVRLISEKLTKQEGVLVHCAGGRGRTGTVIGSFLVRQGFDPDKTIRALDKLYRGFDRPGWPESDWQSEAVRHFAQTQH